MCGQCPVAKQKPFSLTAVWSPKIMEHINSDFQKIPDKTHSITVSYFTGSP